MTHCRASRIMIMDDEEMVRQVVGEVLNHIGCEVLHARDGAEAVALYSTELKAGRRIDAVIMDLSIPGGMGGKDALQLLRQIDPAVKAIISSGYSNDPIVTEYAEYGFQGVISKPYTIANLRDIIVKILSGSASQPPL